MLAAPSIPSATISIAASSICTATLPNSISVITITSRCINVSVRAENALKGIVGKRLVYRRPDEAKVS